MRLEYMGTDQEALFIGDETGLVNIYFIDWPKQRDRDLFGWHGGFQRHAQIAVHSQQICGIAWSLDGELVATSGNDNLCCLYEFKKIMASPETVLRAGDAKHIWRLDAAVKAIAFCPWQRGLLAAGGGSNDRGIHFFHTMSGAALAIIDCAAQVTSLIWSVSRREIVATLGFAQPEHAYRIAVYAWPSCQQVFAIPWSSDLRALYAISYPGSPVRDTTQRQMQAAQASNQPATARRRQRPRRAALTEDPGSAARAPSTQREIPARSSSLRRRPLQTPVAAAARRPEDGCIVVASSEGTIKFHEVWHTTKKDAANGTRNLSVVKQAGLLGGSAILEGMHGIEQECGIIR